MTPQAKAKISAAAKKRWAAIRKAKTAVQEVSMVDHPTAGPVECIDYIEQVLGQAGFVAYLRGCIVKYNHRMMLKNNAQEDAAKLAWCAQRLSEKL